MAWLSGLNSGRKCWHQLRNHEDPVPIPAGMEPPTEQVLCFAVLAAHQGGVPINIKH